MSDTLVRIRSLLEEAGQIELYDYIVTRLTPSVELRSRRENDKLIPIGSSKFGGLPDLLDSADWPRKGGRPLAFLAQINLADMPLDGNINASVPRTGLLGFWYDAAAEPWGFDPKDRGSWRVTQVLSKNLDALNRVPMPPFERGEGLEGDPVWPWEPFESCVMHAYASLSLDVCSLSVMYQQYNEAREDAIEQVIRLLGGEQGEGVHRMVGHPNTIQGDMRLECQLASNGIYFSGEPPESEREKIETLTPGTSDWILLLQIDTDDRESGPGWMWGDVGCLYFWIKKQDLAAGNFDAIWGVLQCY